VVKQVGVGEYILGGTSNSPVSGDKSVNTLGGNDIWLVRIGGSASSRTGTRLTQSATASGVNNATAVPYAITSLSMNVAPNPVQSNMTVSYSSPAGPKLSLKVISEDGKTLLSTTLAATATGSFTTNVAKLPAGVYYVVLQNSTSTVTKRIIKE
jgi:hypothetical protein